MLKPTLWILAIAAIVGPCFYMSSGGGKMASASSQMAMTAQMRQQTLYFDMQLQETLVAEQGPMDAAFIQELVGILNNINEQADSPQAREEARKNGLNPAMLPRPIPWLAAPAKAERSMTLGADKDGLLIQGWGTDLEKPIFERRLPLNTHLN